MVLGGVFRHCLSLSPGPSTLAWTHWRGGGLNPQSPLVDHIVPGLNKPFSCSTGDNEVMLADIKPRLHQSLN